MPLLYFAGTRDTLCDLDLLCKVLGRLKTDWDLEVIDGGDHSFRLLKSVNVTEQEIYDHILQKMANWLKTKI